MLYFPQLSSGAAAQYPITKRRITRTISNKAEDGRLIQSPDPGATRTEWELHYSSLATAEWGSIERLFLASRGRLGTFTFLDPTANLLNWSEDFTKAAWQGEPLLQIAAITGPLSTANGARVTNTAQVAQRLTQRIAGPSWYNYCFSVYARADSIISLRLVSVSALEEAAMSYSIGSEWARVVFSGSLAQQADGISFGIELAPGARVDISGAQVEAQPGSGRYKKTTDRSGVYTRARFTTDEIPLTTDAPEQHSGVIRVTSGIA